MIKMNPWARLLFNLEMNRNKNLNSETSHLSNMALLRLEETLLQSVVEYLLSHDTLQLADAVQSLTLTSRALSALFHHDNTSLWRNAFKLRYGAPPSQRQMNEAARNGFKTYFIRRILLDRRWSRGQFRKSSLECHLAPVVKLDYVVMQKHIDDDQSVADDDSTVAGLRAHSQWAPKQCLVTGSQDGHVVVWDLLTMQTALSDVSMHAPFSVVSVQGNLGSNLMVTADSGSEFGGGEGAKIIGSDCFTGQQQFEIVQEDEIDGGLGPVSSVIAIAENLLAQACGGQVLVWRRHIGSKDFVLLHRIRAHDHAIQCMIRSEIVHEVWSEELQKFTKTYMCVVSGSLDGVVQCIDLLSGKIVFTLQHGSPVQFLSQNGATGVFIAGSAVCVTVYDARGQSLSSVTLDDHPATCMQISMDGRTIVTGSRDSTLSVISVRYGANGAVSLKRTCVLGEVSRNSCTCLHFDAHRLAAGFQDGTIRVYSMSEQWEISGRTPYLVTDITPHMSAITCIAFDPDCEYLAASSKDTGVTVLNYRLLHPYMPPWSGKLSDSNEEDRTVAVKLGIYDAQRQTYKGPPIETWRPDPPFTLDKDIELEHILPGVLENSFLLRNCMSMAECKHYIEQCELVGFEPCLGYNPRYRSNTRVIIEDDELANILFERTKPFLPPTIEHDSYTWDLVGLNRCKRFCKYTPGQHFSPHCDSSYYESEDTRSFLTWMIYMNGGFEKGATNFLSDLERRHVIARVVPETGLCCVFPQETVLHEGEVLASGVKYLLRSDVLYRRRRDI